MITTRHGTTMLLVKPDTVHAHRAALDAIKPAKAPTLKGDRRTYPVFKAGMTTAEYVRKFIETNCGTQLTEAEHQCANYDAAPAGYDPTQPVCFEDHNPEGVDERIAAPVKRIAAPVKVARVKRVKAAQATPDHSQAVTLLRRLIGAQSFTEHSAATADAQAYLATL